MDELRIRDETQEFHGLWQQQHRRRREQYRICQSDNGADGTGVARLLVRIVIGWRLRLSGFARHIRRENTALLIEVYLRRRRLTCGRGLCGDGVEMTKRKRELDGKRK